MHCIKTITEFHNLLGLPKPKHPLLSVVDLNKLTFNETTVWKQFSTAFYSVAFKQTNAKIKYGQKRYDFDEGMLAFTSPNQVLSLAESDKIEVKGYVLIFHPDFLKHHSLVNKINSYGFFSYAVDEALFLSDAEKNTILALLKAIENEYNNNIDTYSQDVILTNIELLLVYANRYYNRQFITRKNQTNDFLTKTEQLLSNYFKNDHSLQNGLPTVAYLAGKLNVSSSYLSDLLKNSTGLTTQQHIHEALIKSAKELLLTTELSVSEIAYQLGFEYSQSFNKLFKKKTNKTPLIYRKEYK
jgi:AraC-like DNA-binding protein